MSTIERFHVTYAFLQAVRGGTNSPVVNARHEAYQMRSQTSPASLSSNMSAAASLKQSLRRGLPEGQSSSGGGGVDGGGSAESVIGQKRKRPDEENGESRSGFQDVMSLPVCWFPGSDSEPEDVVRLWEDGWRERYYQDKFGVPSDDLEFRDSLTEQYTRGLCWVLGYYYQVRITILYGHVRLWDPGRVS